MRFQRALLLIGQGEAPGPALAALRAIAPRLEALVVRLQLAPTLADRLLPESWTAPSDPAARTPSHETLEALVEATAVLDARVELISGGALDAAALAELCSTLRVELLVPAAWSMRNERLVNDVRRQAGVAVLWPGAAAVDLPLTHVGLVALSSRASLRLSAWLNTQALEGGARTFTLLTTSAPTPERISQFMEIAGLSVPLTISALGGWSQLPSWLSGEGEVRFGLLILPRPPPRWVLGVGHAAPVLVLPPLRASGEAPVGPLMVGADAIDDLGTLRLCVEGDVSFGAPRELADGTLTLLAAGRTLGTTALREGVAVVTTPPGLALGVSRGELPHTPEALAQVEAQVEILRPEPRGLLLFDAALPDDVLASLRELDAPERPQPLAVRLRPSQGLRVLRARLRGHGLSGRLLDARAVLDEGPAFDVASELLDPLRLARVAARLQRAGFAVRAIIHQGPHQPAVNGVHAIDAGASGAEADALSQAPAPVVEGPHAPLIAGNAIDLELDNGLARTWLLEAIQQATREVCFQVYMCLDDVEGGQVGDALIDAGARGVRVRMLVDSLHGKHGSFGTRNPLLERLAGRPGVDLRIGRPLTELPSLSDLKQRDHRKLAVADGVLALLGGRNLSHEYYAGWDDVALGPDSQWRDVPWVDAGARVRGPAVSALLASFREAWVEAGGEHFAIETPAPAGTSAARVVVHHGLRDARTLETYRELIEGARSHVMLANGFPYVLELQHCLLQALARGVRVRVLQGHLTPGYGDGQVFKGPWSTARNAATEFVHSRADALILAGAEVHFMRQSHREGWAVEIDAVRPHVHAKVLTVDGLRCAVGSANLDVTASYWESELMLVTEDAGLVGAYESKLAALMEGSPKVDPADPAWQQRARARAWMRHWPGVLSI